MNNVKMEIDVVKTSFLERVTRFVDIAKRDNLKIEAIILSDVDHILFEHHFVPNYRRNIYSHSKSFTSAMIGVALYDKKLSLDDHFVDFVKDEIKPEDYQRLYPIKIRNLLTMSSGFAKPILMYNDRIKGIPYGFTKNTIGNDLKEEPGSRFCYSNGDTHLLTRVIEGAYHESFVTLVNEKLFKPLGIKTPAWEVDMFSHCLGASGLYLNIEEMNKLGRLFLNGGKWNNQQIIDPNYVKECRIKQIDTGNTSWLDCGYTFQFWKVDYHDSYRADGAWGQITFIIDDIGLALSIQCPENGDLCKVLDAIKQKVLVN